ncbi:MULTISPECIES: cell wall-binding repeat-containing protein [unclassified Streptomyces]|uniref:cell wall-binding repeat-containing protein n=1 Tax=unclassified Streptomyces TaxID=2593676 RepID=UPI002E126E4B|nr:cell wall-binding repeat-containing protein [Streptomyces sp. NBC_01236]
MRVFRSSSARRRLVALTAVTALAAGTATALAPGAAADVAGWPATDGRIAVVNDGIMSMDVTGNDEKRVSGGSDDESPAWSPDGSRVVFESAGAVQTISVNGTTRTTVYDGTYSGASPSHPTYWTYGREIVYSAAKKLYSVPADGGTPVRLLSSGGCDSLPSGDATGKLLVFQRNGAGCTTATPSVVLYNATTKTQTTLAAGGGSPALSPDGTKVAFIRSVDGHGQLFSVNTDGTGERRLTNDTGDYDTPSWAPASNRLVVHFNRPTSGGRQESNVVMTITADAVTEGEPFPWGGRSPAWQPLRKNTVVRIWGADVYGSNIAASRWTWNTVGQSEGGLMNASSAVLVSKDSQAYALTAPALAGKKHGPVLLTPATSVSSAVQAELKRVLKPGATVYLVGGTSILSSAVASKVTSLGFTPKRLAGTSRYSTSVAVAKSITSAPQYVFLATGTDYHSALAAASAAGSLGTGGKAVVVLNDGNSLTSSVKSYLNGLDPDTTYMIPVGASAKYAMTHTAFSNWPSTYTYYPVTASTNEGTAAALAKMWWYSPSSVALAYTDSWRGGTSAASAMNVFGPLLWTDLGTLSTETKSYLVRGAASINGVAVFGGTGSVSTTALNSAGAAVSASSTEWTYWPDYNGVPAATSSFSSTGPGAVSQPARTGAALRPTVEPNLAQLGTEAKQ